MENGLRKRIGCVLIVSSTVATACGGGLEGPSVGTGGSGGGSGGVGTATGGLIPGTGGTIGLPPCSVGYCHPLGVPCETDDCGAGGAGGEGTGGEGGSTTWIGIK